MENLTKEEIYETLCGWIDSGKLVQKSSLISGGHWYSVWKAVERGEVFFTSHERIVATDRDVRDRFQELFRAGRIMSVAGVTIRHPECVSAFAVNRLAEQGEILKMGKFSSVTLYVE